MIEFQVAKVGQINQMAFSPDGRRLVVPSGQSNIRIWDAASGKEVLMLKRTRSGHEAYFLSGGEMLTRSKKDVQLFAADGQTFRSIAVSRCGSCIPELAISPNASRFVCMEEAGIGKEQLICRSLPGGEALWQVETSLESHPTLLFSPSGTRVLAIGADEWRTFDAATGQLEPMFPKSDRTYPNFPQAAFRPDGSAVAVRSSTCVYVFDVQTLKELAKTHPVIYPDAPIAFTADGSYLAFAFGFSGNYKPDSCGLCFWDAETWKPRGVLKLEVGCVSALAFSPDGMLAAVAGREEKAVKVAIFDLEDFEDELLAPAPELVSKDVDVDYESFPRRRGGLLIPAKHGALSPQSE